MTPEQTKNALKIIIEKQEADFQALIATRKDLGIRGLNLAALAGDEKMVQLRKESFYIYFEFLLNLSDSLILFPNPPLNTYLSKLGLPPKAISWFTSLDGIEEQFSEISKQNIIVLKYHAIRAIICYLYSKVRAEIFMNCHFMTGDSGDDKDRALADLQKIFRRKDYGQGKLKTYKNDFDIVMNQLIDEMDKQLFNDLKKTKKFFFDSYSGKTEKIYIKELVRSFILPEGMASTRFAEAVAPLMNLLLKDDDKKLLSETDFWEGDALYGNNYNRYLANRIKKISGLDEPDLFESR